MAWYVVFMIKNFDSFHQPSLQFGSQHFKEMTPGDVKIVRIRDQHCLVKFTSLESGWPESGCQSPGPGKVIICDDAPNLSPGLSFKGSYNGCLTTLKILKVYPPPEHHSVVHPKLKTISSDEVCFPLKLSCAKHAPERGKKQCWPKG